MEDVTRVRVVVRGRVQGVGFRAWTVAQARTLGLAGWARNRLDGSVEMVLSGPAAAVEAMTAACRRGPLVARVDAVETSAPPVDAVYPTPFERWPTA